MVSITGSSWWRRLRTANSWAISSVCRTVWLRVAVPSKVNRLASHRCVARHPRWGCVHRGHHDWSLDYLESSQIQPAAMARHANILGDHDPCRDAQRFRKPTDTETGGLCAVLAHSRFLRGPDTPACGRLILCAHLSKVFRLTSWSSHRPKHPPTKSLLTFWMEEHGQQKACPSSSVSLEASLQCSVRCETYSNFRPQLTMDAGCDSAVHVGKVKSMPFG